MCQTGLHLKRNGNKKEREKERQMEKEKGKEKKRKGRKRPAGPGIDKLREVEKADPSTSLIGTLYLKYEIPVCSVNVLN